MVPGIFGITVRRSFIASKDSRASHHILLSHQPSFDGTLRTRLRSRHSRTIVTSNGVSQHRSHACHHWQFASFYCRRDHGRASSCSPVHNCCRCSAADPHLCRSDCKRSRIVTITVSTMQRCLVHSRHEDLLSPSSISSYFSLTDAVDHDCLVFFVRAFRPASSVFTSQSHRSSMNM